MPNTSSMIATCCWRRSCRACCYTTPQRLLYYRQRTEWRENWITFRIHCWTPSTKRLRSIWMYIDTVLVLLLRRKWKLILPCTCCDGYDCCFVENSKLTAYFLYFSFFSHNSSGLLHLGCNLCRHTRGFRSLWFPRSFDSDYNQEVDSGPGRDPDTSSRSEAILHIRGVKADRSFGSRNPFCMNFWESGL